MSKKVDLGKFLNIPETDILENKFYINANYFEAKKLFEHQLIENSFNKTLARYNFNKEKRKKNKDEGMYTLTISINGKYKNWKSTLLKVIQKEN